MYVCICTCVCMYVCMYVCVCVCMSTFSNISSEITGPIEAKFHNEASLGLGNKSLLKGAGHMTKMAAMSIYGKNLKKKNLFLQNPKIADLETWYAALGARVLSQDCSNDDPVLTLTYFTAMSNLVPYAFVWEKCETMDFSETIVVYNVKVGRCS